MLTDQSLSSRIPEPTPAAPVIDIPLVDPRPTGVPESFARTLSLQEKLAEAQANYKNATENDPLNAKLFSDQIYALQLQVEKEKQLGTSDTAGVRPNVPTADMPTGPVTTSGRLIASAAEGSKKIVHTDFHEQYRKKLGDQSRKLNDITEEWKSIQGDLDELALKNTQDALDAQERQFTAETEVRQKFDQVYTDMRNYRIDPNRQFKSVWQVAAAAIAAGLGAYAQTKAAFHGATIPNTALDIINAAIDRDIEAQRSEYNSLKSSADNLKSVYAMMKDAGLSEMSVINATRAAGYEALMIKLNTLTTGFDSADKQASLEKLIADAQQKQEELKNGVIQDKINNDTRLAAIVGREESIQRKAAEKRRAAIDDDKTTRDALGALSRTWKDLFTEGGWGRYAGVGIKSMMQTIGFEDETALDWARKISGSNKMVQYEISRVMSGYAVSRVFNQRITDQDMKYMLGLIPRYSAMAANEEQGQANIDLINKIIGILPIDPETGYAKRGSITRLIQGGGEMREGAIPLTPDEINYIQEVSVRTVIDIDLERKNQKEGENALGLNKNKDDDKTIINGFWNGLL